MKGKLGGKERERGANGTRTQGCWGNERGGVTRKVLGGTECVCVEHKEPRGGRERDSGCEMDGKAGKRKEM